MRTQSVNKFAGAPHDVLYQRPSAECGTERESSLVAIVHHYKKKVSKNVGNSERNSDDRGVLENTLRIYAYLMRQGINKMSLPV